MRIIGRKTKDKQDLELTVNVGRTQNIDILDDFQCNLVCLVTTNVVYSKRTSTLRRSSTRWNETLKLRLPRSPKSKWLRIVIYDALPITPLNDISNTNFSRNSGSNLSLSKLKSESSLSNAHLNNYVSGVSPQQNQNSKLLYKSTSHDHLSTTHSNDSSSLETSYSRSNASSPVSTHSRDVRGSDTDLYQMANKKNNQKKRYLYLGEVRLSLLDLFRSKDTRNQYKFTVGQNWYKLYDRKREKLKMNVDEENFIIGEILLGFQLRSLSRSKTTFDAYNDWSYNLTTTLKNEKYMRSVRKNPTESDINNLKNNLLISNSRDDADDMSISENDLFDDDDDVDELDDIDDIDDDVDDIIQDLASTYHQELDNAESNDDMESMLSAYDIISDVVSLSETITDHNNSPLDIGSMATALDEYDVLDQGDVAELTNLIDDQIIEEQLENIRNISLIDDFNEEKLLDNSNSDESNSSSLDSKSMGYFTEEIIDESDEEIEDQADDLVLRRTKGKLAAKLRGKKNTIKQTKNRLTTTLSNNYKLTKKRHALGVIFLELQEIRNLPQLKNKISRKNYDMDPFVIMTFGRRVFKTSFRKHNLNPVFNEFATFEVLPQEAHFGIQFKIMDKDSFSYNDHVARTKLPWNEISCQNFSDDVWSSYELPLELTVDPLRAGKSFPVLHVRLKYVPYQELKDYFWKTAVRVTAPYPKFDVVQLLIYLDKLGSFTESEAIEFFTHFRLSPWNGSTITQGQLVEVLRTWKKLSGFNHIWKCPNCLQSFKSTTNSKNSKLYLENDLITHFAMCTFSRKHKLLKPSYVSTDFASKRWFSKFLIKLTYGKYALGSNNANILVQDRDTGVILEEKISAHVKLGMRIIYNGKGPETKKFKTLLKKMSVRQGKKFDSPGSVSQIPGFIRFHSLDLSECEEIKYRTFNEFFYRKLKPGSRVPEGDSPKILVSPADSRSIFFPSINESKKFWIKGSLFTIRRLTNGYKPDLFNERSCSIAIFRLAPQDYHRFHSPCDGIIGKPVYIAGEYFTVNPMAIRSSLDVFGENVRVLIPIETQEFGPILLIAVGAMMVGSIILTCKEGQTIRRGEELGYFKFGGSTIISLVPSKHLRFDSDLLNNSSEQIETLIRVGMSIGHTPDTKEYRRKTVKVSNMSQLERVKRIISISDENSSKRKEPWQVDAIREWLSEEYEENGDEHISIIEEK
ncbi:hypothetical protein Kpol_538p27 [Vanderwaltozyma polyspora DSM 70294]|uniref:Phosphatidylserine decarboxylase proenzyme 2 n=1 Tax=Vanderwaltozyma polyspora (strain ATCC 22028 / DSM 70294 / BCRC 21397 / CBS 2163 / NBRC 10782 / NRRL Y-8283 / UCD 57-17) TaxID=436907 RepID=A7TKE0_VANPO|nr:uncharacterized protein Kpol_538p27 [Vanderwaltozyma polyspora DSM 70294]EDO17267.1 hypothetical protein Kpol_538p27 [Vanderwaltozyma polyspora DSM 70294]